MMGHGSIGGGAGVLTKLVCWDHAVVPSEPRAIVKKSLDSHIGWE